MGCLQSILAKVLGGGADEGDANDVELAVQAIPITLNPKTKGPELKLTNNNTTCSGFGTVLADAAIEQDSAYWEAKIVSSGGGQFCLGVAKKQDRKKLNEVAFPDDENTWGFSTSSDDNSNVEDDKKEKEKGEDEEVSWGFEAAEKDDAMKFKDGDVIGIVMDYTDLPMLSFYKNGILMDDASVRRIRGTVYPAVRILEGGVGDGVTTIEMVFGPKDQWTYPPPRKHCSQIVKSQDML